MKILHYVKVLSAGGVGQAISGLVRHMPHEAHVAVEGEHVDLLCDYPVHARTGPRELLQLLEREDFDLIHWHWWTEMPAMAAIEKHVAGMPQVLTLHVYSQLPQYRLTDREIRMADRIAFCSSTARDLGCNRRIPEEKGRFILAGAELEGPLANEPTRHSGFHIGRCSDLDPVKCPPDIVRVLDRIQIPGVRFTVAGDGALLEPLRREASLSEPGRYDFPGFVRDVPTLLSSLDVYCYQLPGHSYAASELNLQEAMASGLAVVLLPSPGCRELVQDGVTGLTVATEDELVEACERLYREPDLRRELGDNARAHAQRSMGAIYSAREYATLYQEAYANRRGLSLDCKEIRDLASRHGQASEKAYELLTSWQDPDIPRQQRALADRGLEDMRNGNPPAEFAVFGEVMRDLLRPSDQILDIGCASGYYKTVLDHYCGESANNYVGVDFSEAMLEDARSRCPDGTFLRADARSIPLPSGSADVVFSSAMLEHIPDYEPALDEIFRLARRHVVLHRTWMAPHGETTTAVERGYANQEYFRIGFGGRHLAHLLVERGARNTRIYPVRPHADPTQPGHFLLVCTVASDPEPVEPSSRFSAGGTTAVATRDTHTVYRAAQTLRIEDRPCARAELEHLTEQWKDAEIPALQGQVVTHQLEELRHGRVDPVFQSLLRSLVKIHLPSFSFLDAACASGYYSEVLKLDGRSIEYVGSDYSPHQIDVARKNYPDLKFEVQDLTETTFTERQFDVVMAAGVLEHMPSYEKAIDELARISREYVILHRLPLSFTAETSYHIGSQYSIMTPRIRFSAAELEERFADHGFHVVEEALTYHGNSEGPRTVLLKRLD